MKEIEQNLVAHRLGGLDELPDSFVMPHYAGYSIANVPATVGALLGVEMDTAPPVPRATWDDLAAGVQRVVLVILDGVGYHYLSHLVTDKASLWSRLAQSGRLVPLTSVFPSTTVSALTTLHTGRAPAEHGFIGTKLLLPEQGVLSNMLKLAPAAHPRSEMLLDWGWVPDEFVTAPSMMAQLTAAGVPAVALSYYPYLAGGLSRIFGRGATQSAGYIGFADAWINLRRALIEGAGQRAFYSLYWDGFDTLGHVYGPESEPCRVEMGHLARSIEEDLLAPLPTAAREGTLLMFVADHGFTPTPPERAVYLCDHPELRRMLLLPPAGEPRAAYLYVRPGLAADVRAYVDAHWSGRFTLLEMEQALASGLFGPAPVAPEVRARLGDALLLALDDSRVLWDRNEEPLPLRGHHGSLSAEEMLVPLLMARLDG